MVYLSRIYTKTGDDGSTGLGNGCRVEKDCVRVESYGMVDEANAAIGLLRTHLPLGHVDQQILEIIQNDLFDVGADLCIPVDSGQAVECLRVVSEQVCRLEKTIDLVNENLQPLTSFILPSGSHPSVYAHFARTIVRRAERAVVALQKIETINSFTLIYLNRLSDLLFVLARRYNENGLADILWIPGNSRPTT